MFGIPLEPSVSCTEVVKYNDAHAWHMFMLERCNFRDGLFNSAATKQAFLDKFETECKSKDKCTLRFRDYRYDLSPYCKGVEQQRKAKGGAKGAFLLGQVNCIGNKI